MKKLLNKIIKWTDTLDDEVFDRLDWSLFYDHNSMNENVGNYRVLIYDPEYPIIPAKRFK